MDKTSNLSNPPPSNIYPTFIDNFSIKEVALKVLLLGTEISLAVGTFYLFTERYITTIVPHLAPWNLTITCIGVNLVATFMIGSVIHWVREPLCNAIKKHSWTIKVISDDLIKACAIGCLTRVLKACFTHQNPIFSFKGKDIISLEAAAISAVVLLIFMNLQHTGTRLYEEEEISKPEEIPTPQPNEQPAPNTNGEDSSEVVKQLKEQTSQLSRENDRLKAEKLNAEQKATKSEEELKLLQQQLEEQKVIGEQKMKALEAEMKQQLERQKSEEATNLQQRMDKLMLPWEQAAQETQDLLKSFTKIDEKSPSQALQEELKNLHQQYTELYSTYKSSCYFQLLPAVQENQELRKENAGLSEQLEELHGQITTLKQQLAKLNKPSNKEEEYFDAKSDLSPDLEQN